MKRVIVRGLPTVVVGLVLGATDWPLWVLGVVGVAFIVALFLHDEEVERQKGEYDAELVGQAYERIDAFLAKRQGRS